MPYFKMYEWDLLIFCKQTPFLLAIIGTLTPLTNGTRFESYKSPGHVVNNHSLECFLSYSPNISIFRSIGM